MPRAQLTLTIPEGVWIGDVSRAHPDVRFRILAAIPGEDTGVGLTEVITDDPADVLRDVDAREEVIALEFLQRAEDRALVQFETTDPLLLFPVQSSGVPLEMPFEIREGEATWELTAPQDRLAELGEQLDAFGISFTVDHLHQRVEPEQLLTDGQADLVEAAVERGYYDTPRTCSLTELADDLDMAKSTCSETLHRAEGKIIKQFVADGEAGERSVAGE